jgi:hypothetical protein
VVGSNPTPPPEEPFVLFVVVHCKQNPSAGGEDPPEHSKFHSKMKLLLYGIAVDRYTLPTSPFTAVVRYKRSLITPAVETCVSPTVDEKFG